MNATSAQTESIDPNNAATPSNATTPSNLATVATLAPSAFSSLNADDPIPANWEDRAQKAWSYYLEEPLVSNAINAWHTFSIGEEIRLSSDDDGLKEQAEELADRLDISGWLKDMILQLLIKGDAFAFKQPDLSDLTAVNPLSIRVKYHQGRLIKVEQRPENQFEHDWLSLPLHQVCHLKWNAPSFSPRGNSMVLPAFRDIDILRDYRRAEQAIAKRWATPLRLIKVGGAFGPKIIMPDQTMLESVRDMINRMDMKSGLVVPYYVSVETHGTESHVLNTEAKVHETKEDIMVALGMSRSLISGDGPNFATASISLQKMLIMIKEIKKSAKKMLRWVFDDWLDANGYDRRSLQYHFNDLDPTDAIDFKRILLELYDRNLISRKSLQLKMDLDPDREKTNQANEAKDISISDDREVKNLLAAVASGIISPETARNLLNLKDSLDPGEWTEALKEKTMGQLHCDQCAHFNGDTNHCGIHDAERAFDEPSCRFFEANPAALHV